MSAESKSESDLSSSKTPPPPPLKNPPSTHFIIELFNYKNVNPEFGKIVSFFKSSWTNLDKQNFCWLNAIVNYVYYDTGLVIMCITAAVVMYNIYKFPHI